jgi:hypothetical protein
MKGRVLKIFHHIPSPYPAPANGEGIERIPRSKASRSSLIKNNLLEETVQFLRPDHG